MEKYIVEASADQQEVIEAFYRSTEDYSAPPKPVEFGDSAINGGKQADLVQASTGGSDVGD